MKPTTNDGRCAEVRQRADKGQKQGHQNAGTDERDDHIPEDRTGRGTKVTGGTEAAGVQPGKETPQKHGVERHKGDGQAKGKRMPGAWAWNS